LWKQEGKEESLRHEEGEEALLSFSRSMEFKREFNVSFLFSIPIAR